MTNCIQPFWLCMLSVLLMLPTGTLIAQVYSFTDIFPNLTDTVASTAQSQPPARLQDNEDDDEIFFSEDLVQKKLIKDDLGLSSEEVRMDYKYGGGLTLGIVAPWQTYSLFLIQLSSHKVATTLSLGRGSFELEDSKDNENYKIELKSYGLVYGRRYFITDTLPLFIEGEFGYTFWRGQWLREESPVYTDDSSSKVHFNISGPVIGFNFGIMCAWESGYFLEYSIFRVGKGVAIFTDFSPSRNGQRRTIINDIETPYSWGYGNIRLGRLF